MDDIICCCGGIFGIYNTDAPYNRGKNWEAHCSSCDCVFEGYRTLEAITIAIKEHVESHGWHTLTDDPGTYPEENGEYLVKMWKHPRATNTRIINDVALWDVDEKFPKEHEIKIWKSFGIIAWQIISTYTMPEGGIKCSENR